MVEGVSVPRFPSMPSLTVVVPVGSDLTAFESSLVSVLENRPRATEIIVAHDGTYDDPFDLADEVRFVVAESGRLVDLVAAGVAQAVGPVVHILGGGMRATDGWTAAAVERFGDAETGVVIPVIRSDAGPIVAAGWRDHSGGLCQPIAAGRQQVGSDAIQKVGGPFLEASFWRRDVIRGLGGSFLGADSVEASYAYGLYLRAVACRQVLAKDCQILFADSTLPWNQPSFRRGQRLGAIENVLTGSGWRSAFASAALGSLAVPFSQTTIAEVCGRLMAPLASGQLRRQLRQPTWFDEHEREHVLPFSLPRHTQRRHAA